MIGERTIDGVPALTLASEAAGGIEAAIVPGAGMVVCSLRHRGEELLGQRGGLRTTSSTTRRWGFRCSIPGRTESRGTASRSPGATSTSSWPPPPSRDPAGLPIHGLLGAAAGWRVESHSAHPDGGVLQASFDFAAHPGLTDAFPFPHRLLFEAALHGPALSITTTVAPRTEHPVPIAFGYHPYFRLPGVDRADWEVEIPVAERMLLDRRLLPTGEREPVEVAPGAARRANLRRRVRRAARAAAVRPRRRRARDRGRVRRGFPFAQVYAPADDDVIAFEPMTAPTNALVAAVTSCRSCRPGDRYEASFSITVSDRT